MRKNLRLFVPDPDGIEDVPVRVGAGDLGAAIRAFRRERHLTIEALAWASGVNLGAISRIERGAGTPTWTTLANLAEALDLHVSVIVLDAENRSAENFRAGAERARKQTSKKHGPA